MSSVERRPLLQIGPSVWVAIDDIVAIDWNDKECCPRAMLSSGATFSASFFKAGLEDTPELRTSALLKLIRKARKRSADIIVAKSLLTTRETEVLEALAMSEANHEIAKRLFMSESTVKSHMLHIYDKLGVKNRTGAVMAGIHLGIIDSDPAGELPGSGPSGGRY